MNAKTKVSEAVGRAIKFEADSMLGFWQSMPAMAQQEATYKQAIFAADLMAISAMAGFLILTTDGANVARDLPKFGTRGDVGNLALQTAGAARRTVFAAEWSGDAYADTLAGLWTVREKDGEELPPECSIGQYRLIRVKEGEFEVRNSASLNTFYTALYAQPRAVLEILAECWPVNLDNPSPADLEALADAARRIEAIRREAVAAKAAEKAKSGKPDRTADSAGDDDVELAMVGGTEIPDHAMPCFNALSSLVKAFEAAIIALPEDHSLWTDDKELLDDLVGTARHIQAQLPKIDK